MAAALTFLLIGCLLEGAQFQVFEVFTPQSIEALSGSCVTIPCSFNIESKYKSNLDQTCKAKWISNGNVVFDSAKQINGELRGKLTEKDCTTTLNNLAPDTNNKYHFRLECNNPLKYSFDKDLQVVEIMFKDAPPSPTLTPPTLEVTEGTSVSLTCSAPAPCLSHPPTLTWTPDLGDIQETLQEDQDKTKVKKSVLTFTASHLHHGKTISCTATYRKQGGSTLSSVSRDLTANISYSPKTTTVSVSPSGPVREDSSVTLTCSSAANPAVSTYTWYRADGEQETVVGTGQTLNVKASQVNRAFICKAENYLGVEQSTISQLDVQYSPKHTTVSVSPSGPVREDSSVTLTCSSAANPAVRTYTWYRADGDQETLIGTGHILNIKASQVNRPFFCKAENDLGVGRSNYTQLDVQFLPQILHSSNCITTTNQVNCSCETVGNPSPILHWYLGGLPLNHSDKFAISNELLNYTTGQRSIITVNQPQSNNLSTLVCQSSNSLGTASQRFCVTSLQQQTSAGSQGQVTLSAFIATVVALLLLLLVCALLFIIRVQKTHHNLPKTQCTGDTSTVAVSQLLTRIEGNEAPNTTEEDVYVNTYDLTQEYTPHPVCSSEPHNSSLPCSGPNNVEEASESSEKKREKGSDVIYSSINWKRKSKKKKQEDSVDMDPPDGSYLEEESRIEGGVCTNAVSNALEMGNMYNNVQPRNVKKEVDCEYAQVKFKPRNGVNK